MWSRLVVASVLLGLGVGGCQEDGRPYASHRTEKVLMKLLPTGHHDMTDVVVSLALPARYAVVPQMVSVHGRYEPMTVFQDVDFASPGSRYVPHLEFRFPPGPARPSDPPPPLCRRSELAGDAVLAPYVYERGQDGSDLAVCVSVPRPRWTWSDPHSRLPRLLHIRRRIPVMGHWLECHIDLVETWPSPRDLGDLLDICRSVTIESVSPTPPAVRWKMTGRTVESVVSGAQNPTR